MISCASPSGESNEGVHSVHCHTVHSVKFCSNYGAYTFICIDVISEFADEENPTDDNEV